MDRGVAHCQSLIVADKRGGRFAVSTRCINRWIPRMLGDSIVMPECRAVVQTLGNIHIDVVVFGIAATVEPRVAARMRKAPGRTGRSIAAKISDKTARAMTAAAIATAATGAAIAAIAGIAMSGAVRVRRIAAATANVTM